MTDYLDEAGHNDALKADFAGRAAARQDRLAAQVAAAVGPPASPEETAELNRRLAKLEAERDGQPA